MPSPGSADLELELLRPVLELAVVIAQAGQRVTPVVAAPVLLRPYLRFTHKVPAPALRVARRVLDEDEDWRARVALVVTDELVGRAGVLFAQRPEGWQDEFDRLRSDLEATREAGAAGQTGRTAERRLSAAEDTARRAEATARLSEEALGRLREEVSAQQAALSAEVLRRTTAERHGAALEREVDALRSREAAHRQLEESHARLEESHARLAERLADLEVLATQREAVAKGAQRALATLDELRMSLEQLRDGATDEDPAALADITQAFDRTVVARPTPSRAERAAVRAAARPRSERVPLMLPPAVFAESVDAARYLVRAQGVLVLVDGYNVAKSKWPAAKPADLRSRLDAALGDVATRANADVLVVYDGVDEGGVQRPVGASRRAVRVLFSSAEVEADDVVLDLVAATPSTRPVVVVSSDRRVQDGAARLGANVVTSQQFTASWGSVG